MDNQRMQNRFKTHFVSTIDSEEFNLLQWSLAHSTVVGLDAEWKPRCAADHVSLPEVSLFQIACRVCGVTDGDCAEGDCQVYLLDLQSIPLAAVWESIKVMFTSPHTLKLGFKFKQDFAFLSSTFRSHGCSPGFESVEPYLDITTIYYHLKGRCLAGKSSKETKSLAAICAELLDVHLLKELQCSDWSHRPLSEEQKSYAAADAYYLLEIFAIFQSKILSEGHSVYELSNFMHADREFGLRLDINKLDRCANNLQKSQVCEATEMMRMIAHSFSQILLNTSDGKSKLSKGKEMRQQLVGTGSTLHLDAEGGLQGPPPWDPSLGGDGHPKFLCDVMVEGLARHLRCVGIDTAVPSSKKPEPRDLINQAHKEKRVLLTRDAKLLRHRYLIKNQIYRVKSLLKNDQLVEVVETFQLEIHEHQLMSRCTKCNGRFFCRPLTTEEAIEAAKEVQVIPDALFGRDVEFWQCMDCRQLYWEGTQYHNAVHKFVEMFKLSGSSEAAKAHS